MRSIPLAAFLIFAGAANAQLTEAEIEAAKHGNWAPGQFMRQAIDGVVDMATIVAREADYGFDADRLSLFGALVQPAASVEMVFELSGGQSYVFLGSGDEDATDIDIVISDSSGTVLSQDTENDATPMVAFAPAASGPYTVRLRLYGAARSSFCALAVLRRGARPFPLERLSESLDTILVACEAVDQVSGGAGFLDVENRWGLYGGILAEGEKRVVTNVSTAGGPYAFVASGDSKALDVDLELQSPDGTIVERDAKADPYPFFLVQTDGFSSYHLVVTNYDSSEPAFVLMAALKVAN